MERARLLAVRDCCNGHINTYIGLSCVGSKNLLEYLNHLYFSMTWSLMDIPSESSENIKKLSDFTDLEPMGLYFRVISPSDNLTAGKYLTHKQIQLILRDHVITNKVESFSFYDGTILGREVYDIMVDRDELTSKIYDSEKLMFIQDLMKQRSNFAW